MIKNKKSFLTIALLSLIMLMSIVSGCGSTTASNDKSTDNSLAKIKEKGTLVVGMNADFAPYEFHAMVDGKDTIAGFDADVAREIAKDMGVKLEIKELSFDALMTTLQSKQVDVLISGLSATKERRKSVDFTDSYYHSPNVVLTTKEKLSQFNTFDDLKGKKIGVQLSSLQDHLMSKLLPDGNFSRIDSMSTLMLSLSQGQIDAIVTAEDTCKMAIASNPDLVIAKDIKIDDSSLDSPGVAVALPKDSPALKEQMNKTIKRLKDSGEFTKFVDKACALAASQQKK